MFSMINELLTPCTAAASLDSLAHNVPVPLDLSSNHAISCLSMCLNALSRVLSVRYSPAIPYVQIYENICQITITTTIRKDSLCLAWKNVAPPTNIPVNTKYKLYMFASLRITSGSAKVRTLTISPKSIANNGIAAPISTEQIEPIVMYGHSVLFHCITSHIVIDGPVNFWFSSCKIYEVN